MWPWLASQTIAHVALRMSEGRVRLCSVTVDPPPVYPPAAAAHAALAPGHATSHAAGHAGSHAGSHAAGHADGVSEPMGFGQSARHRARMREEPCSYTLGAR